MFCSEQYDIKQDIKMTENENLSVRQKIMRQRVFEQFPYPLPYD
jgi:hypothetical protein